MVIGHAGEAVRQALGGAADYVVQEPQLGTGHAVMQAESLLRGKADLVLVTYADMPLVTAETLSNLVRKQQAHAGPITMLTVLVDDPRGFGRVIRKTDGSVQEVIEEAQATPSQLSIRELNVGMYCFDAGWLWEALKRIPLSPKGEYYLTDLVGIAGSDGLPVQAVTAEDPAEVIGINTRVHLAEATALLRQRINRAWMLAGVTLLDPATTYIESEVTIGQDTVIWPNTYLHGKTVIGQACTLGPNTIIHDTQIGNRCEVLASVLEKAVVEDDVDIGPFGHLRKGAHLAKGVHMGNFGEVNIGAGTITCNFGMDGKKNPTEIGEGAFIGSDTMLVAPVKIGAGAVTGSGAVVTKDVPPETLVVGVPARAIRKLERRKN
jgi:bifunctional UDP-N-acetylglucosamine pyrophosphorylase/glucosamine-1-phosphate N-acetyltransferase